MDKLTMIDALRERADISYEEAKTVLEAAGDDLLEAILILEKEGKIHIAQETETCSAYISAHYPPRQRSVCHADTGAGSSASAFLGRHDPGGDYFPVL